ncbi:MAG: CarD family transcriptional regulator [Terriglobia bacterium]
MSFLPLSSNMLAAFKVGEKVVYPNQGVGVIEQITFGSLNGRPERFYSVHILANRLKVTVPVSNAAAVGLRRIIKAREVPNVLRALQNGKFDSHQNWKSRFKQNSEKMRTGSLYEVAEVLKSLLALNRTKVLSFREKKMLEQAHRLLVAELAVVRNVTDATIEQSIQKALAKSKLRLPEPTESS